MSLKRDIEAIKSNIEEIAVLSDLYEELVTTVPKSEVDLETISMEAKMARDDLLRRSLFVKEGVKRLQKRESMK